MRHISPGVLSVEPDEPAFSLSEVNLQAPGQYGVHRYRVVYVVRHGRLAEHWEDLGPAHSFSASEFRIPGGVWDADTGHGEIVHTVAELRDIALSMHDVPQLPDAHTPRPLKEEFIAQVERKYQLRRELSL